jgi:LacI family transcriptional regulator
MRRPGPNLRSLARDLGLSVTTVSRALKDAPEVRPETRARVQAAATAQGYVPDTGGIYLRTGRTMKVCSVLFTPDVTDFGDSGFLFQVESLAEGLGPSHYHLVVVTETAADTPLDPIRRVFEPPLADAVVFARTTPLDARARYCRERGYPFVTFGRTELPTPHAFVDHDDEAAVHDAVGRLAAAGHRRIALVNPPGDLTYLRFRLRGYRRALAEAGLPSDPALMLTAPASLSGHRDAAAGLLGRDHSVTAVVGSNQVTLRGLLEGVTAAGRDTLLDGIELVGFGGTPLHLLADQRVTYYFQPQRRVGALLARHVLALLGGGDPRDLATVLPYRRIDDVSEFRRVADLDSLSAP